jgi:hypothetical protein
MNTSAAIADPLLRRAFVRRARSSNLQCTVGDWRPSSWRLSPSWESKLLEEREGEGREAQKGDRVVYNCRLFLNKGDEVPLNAKQVEHLPKDMIRVEGVVRQWPVWSMP